jgi:hypothetical protein
MYFNRLNPSHISYKAGMMNSFNEKDKVKVVCAAAIASASDVVSLTADRIEALAAGHGTLNMAVFSIANVITEEMLGGADLTVKFANVRHLPYESIMKKAIEAARQAGADSANAALLVAAMMYLNGAAAQVGIPAGNRKLGATARMLAKVDRCGVAAIPTTKLNNKLSGFPAVQAIYQAMMDGTLSPVNGWEIPLGISGALYGHSALGEDVIWPQMAENGGRIGTQAMLDAMAGAGIHPNPFMAAILGAAAILEVIHPDADVGEHYGAYGKVNSAYLVGESAVKTAGLPEKLHLKVTGQEYNAARVIGDLGLILKDVGGPSVIGMMTLAEIFSAFKEGISGMSGGPVNSPLGHIAAYAVIGMKMLVENDGDVSSTAAAIAKERMATSFDPETAMISINLITHKASELRRGIVTDTLLKATDPVKSNAIQRRVEFTYNTIASGKTIGDVVKRLDEERQETVEKNAGRLFTEKLGKPVTFKLLKIESGARRKTSKIAQKYLGFDPLIDIKVTVGEQSATMEGFVHDIVPKACRGERDDVAWAIPHACGVVKEFILAGNNIINAVVPAATAAAMGANTPKEAAEKADKASYISAGIPSVKQAAEKVAELALSIVNCNY